MKKAVLRFFSFIAILFIVDQLLHGFEFNSPVTMLFLALLLTVFQIFIRPTISFLTLPINFFSFGLFNFLVSVAMIYLFSLLISGFTISNGYISAISNSDIQVSSISLSRIAVIIVSSLFIALLNNLTNWALDDKK